MAAEYSVKASGLEEWFRDLSKMPEEIRFRTAKTLTLTAKAVQKSQQAHMARTYNVRNRQLLKGIRIQPATKDRMVAAVYTIDEFWKLHESGGTKRPRSAATLAIPDARRPAGSVKRTGSGRISSGTRPRSLLARSTRKAIRPSGLAYGRRRASPGEAKAGARFFVVKFKDGRSALVRSIPGKIAGRRRLKGKKGRTRIPRVLARGFRFVYTFSRDAQLPPTFDFLKNGTMIVERYMVPKMLEEVDAGLDRLARGR